MKKKIAVATVVVMTGGIVAVGASQASAMDFERESYKRCGSGVANLALEKENGYIEADFEVENVSPGRTWRLQLAHNGTVRAKSTLPTDYEGDVDISRQVTDTRGKDRFVAKAMGPNGEMCRVKLAI